MKRALIFLLFSCISSLIIAQVTYEKRVEFELKDGYLEEVVFPFGEEGVLMRSRKWDTDKQQMEWKFERFNTDLESINSESAYLGPRYYLVETFVGEDRLYTFFRTRKGDFELVTTNASTHDMNRVSGKIPKKVFSSGMVTMADKSYFLASRKKVPYLFSINWITGEFAPITSMVGQERPKYLELLTVQVLHDQKDVFFFFQKEFKGKKSEIWLVHVGEDGNVQETINLSQNIEENLISASASKVAEGEYIITGTYSAKSVDSSEGLFVGKIKNGKLLYLQLYNFLDLENFLNYLPERRQAKVERKKLKKEAKGKELLIEYLIAAHDVIPLEDGFLYLGEAYYPTYRTTTTTRTVNGVATTTYQTVFDGYQYTHAVLAKFDSNGNLVWDEIFKMYPRYKPFKVKRFINVEQLVSKEVKMVFTSYTRIHTKVVDYEGKVVLDEESEEFETGYDADNSKWALSDVIPWYDNYFLAYGSAKIKNKEDKNVKRKRKVYFMNKIRVD